MASAAAAVTALQSQGTSSLVEGPSSLLEFNKAISGFVKKAQWRRALAVLPELEQQGLKASVVTCNTAISACARGAQWELAMLFLHQLQHERLADVITFSTTLSSLEVASLWARALALLFSTCCARISPNSVTYNAAISACAKGDSDSATVHVLFLVYRMVGLNKAQSCKALHGSR